MFVIHTSKALLESLYPRFLCMQVIAKTQLQRVKLLIWVELIDNYVDTNIPSNIKWSRGYYVQLTYDLYFKKKNGFIYKNLNIERIQRFKVKYVHMTYRPKYDFSQYKASLTYSF